MDQVNHPSTSPPADVPDAPLSSTVKDPVCGMTVDPSKARGKSQFEGETYYFCSPGCMHKFVSDPPKHLTRGEQPALSPAASLRKPGKDPVCGMAVEPSKAAASIEYEGRLFHFCSKGCAEKFKNTPERYLSPNYKPGGMSTLVQLGAGKKFESDPVCGMNVEPVKAAGNAPHNGKTYHFCSRGCLDKFKADPGKYLAPEATSQPAATVGRIGTNASTPAYVCPMDPEVRKSGPGPCPKCGMALEPETPLTTRTQWTCPMHPEIVRDGPGSCPICGMALEPMTVTAAEEENPELRDMTRRFWWSVLLGVPLVALAMLHMGPLAHTLSTRAVTWIEFALATPIVLWCGWPFFQRGWASVKFRSPNMFTLIAMGVGVAYIFSAVATIAPRNFPSVHARPRWAA